MKEFLAVCADIASVVAVVSVIVTLFKVVKMERENRRMNEKVDLFFQVEESDRIEPTGLYIRRKDFTRSEVLGTMRMVMKDQGFFSTKHTSEVAFLDSLEKVQSGKDKRWLIPVAESEFVQFVIPGNVPEQDAA
ncbi:hypothetical protein [Desulfoluna butyratoxydans]|uniref:Uncharacterized protein n=1 Tax=Desulfoluna butyratoxydans TaxID=231438 RepID=A0A4U8YPK1_9BACT|nr:hypothetical protein [Desulfoluna butyratoxydans]VFQ43173.1 hypothetical protein MSL71_8010 [Desulfoluna butyratoxydans]